MDHKMFNIMSFCIMLVFELIDVLLYHQLIYFVKIESTQQGYFTLLICYYG